MFADNLKRLCTLNNTTPTALCKALGLSTSKVSAWNNGSLPKQEVMLQLAKRLNCSVKDFFADKADDLKKVEPANDDERDILAIYRKLSRRDRHEFMSIVYGFDNREVSS